MQSVQLPPQVTDEQLDALMAYEIPSHLPLNGGTFTYDYTRAGGDDAVTEVLLVVARRNTFANHLDVLKRAGLEPSRVLPSMLAFAASVLSHVEDPALIGATHWCAIHDALQ